MNAPLLRAGLALAAAILMLAGLRIALLFWPADLAANGPELDDARIRRNRLAPFTDDRRALLQDRERRLRRELWTPATFSLWRKNHLPPGWVVQDLGPIELKTCRARRYAFTRPAATFTQWTEITGFLSSLEANPGVRVQTVALATKPGYLGSRTFSQCMFVSLFFFADDAPAGPDS